jgi:hypothetical protein
MKGLRDLSQGPVPMGGSGREYQGRGFGSDFIKGMTGPRSGSNNSKRSKIKMPDMGGGGGGNFEKVEDPTGQGEPWVRFNTKDMDNWTEQQLKNFGSQNFSMGQHKFESQKEVFDAYKNAMEKYL